MKKTISKELYDELQLLSCIDDEAYHSKLGEIGVDVKPYRAYQYFDEYGNYKGDSDDMTVDDLLDAMDISVEEKPMNCGECTYCKKNSFSLDHRTKNWHECCILAKKEIGVATHDLSTAMPDWCPLNKEERQ